jgi:quercetin dioxygenase-like cupin family protein
MTVNVYQAIGKLKPARIWDGVLARVVHGDRLSIGFVDIDPDVLVPEHRHENEQVGFVLRGSVTMVVGGQSRELQVGETYTIASQVPHSAKAGADGASVVDVFAPVREEWKAAPTVEPFPGRWPEPSR